MQRKILQVLFCFQHFLVDAICLACVLGIASRILNGSSHRDYLYLLFLIAMYNTLAFCTQWITGWFCDTIQQDKIIHIFYVICLFTGVIFCIYGNLYTGIIFLGLGNSFFHTVGGRYVILNSSGKAGPLGTFVAPGALGVYIGTVWPDGLLLFCMMLILNVIFIYFYYPAEKGDKSYSKFQGSKLRISVVILMVLLCITCRAASGSVSLPGSQLPEYLDWLPVLFVFSGKIVGGYAGDRFGICLTGVLALVCGTFMFFCEWNITFLLGQFLMNLLMALTLWLLVKVLPELPGLAFGLAATVLYPGSLIRLTWEPLLVLILLSCGSIFCFWVACYNLKEKKVIR